MLIYEYDEEDGDYEYSFELLVDMVDEIFKFPVELKAIKSNYRGQTGIAESDDAHDMINKCLSFGNDTLSLYKEDNSYYFRTASHDVPCGFTIEIKEN